jgi:hypothetical protein
MRNGKKRDQTRSWRLLKEGMDEGKKVSQLREIDLALTIFSKKGTQTWGLVGLSL